MDAGRARIERLIHAGKIGKKAGRVLIEALDYDDRRKALPTTDPITRVLHGMYTRTPSGESIRNALFISGRIATREYFHLVLRESAVFSGLAFIGGLAVIGLFELIERRPFRDPGWGLRTVGLIGGSCLFLAACLCFGGWISLFRLKRLRRWTEETPP